MPFTLKTITSKIETVPNTVNRGLIAQFYENMKERDVSNNHKINNLKVVMSYAYYLGPETSFHEIDKRDEILSFLDTKKRAIEGDPDKKWITTWNYYLNRLKLFFRWLYNRDKTVSGEHEMTDWITPEFMQIKQKKSKRVSPYSESEIWDKDDILMITKYEIYKGNKAILALLWDLDARPHEITLLKIKHISIIELKKSQLSIYLCQKYVSVLM